jgi:hypothetical protein
MHASGRQVLLGDHRSFWSPKHSTAFRSAALPLVQIERQKMKKEDALAIIKLLSALESWAFSTKTLLPDYLHDDLHSAVEKLDAIVLGEGEQA